MWPIPSMDSLEPKRGFSQTGALFPRFSVSHMTQAGSGLGSRRKTEWRRRESGERTKGWGSLHRPSGLEKKKKKRRTRTVLEVNVFNLPENKHDETSLCS